MFLFIFPRETQLFNNMSIKALPAFHRGWIISTTIHNRLPKKMNYHLLNSATVFRIYSLFKKSTLYISCISFKSILIINPNIKFLSLIRIKKIPRRVVKKKEFPSFKIYYFKIVKQIRIKINYKIIILIMKYRKYWIRERS